MYIFLIEMLMRVKLLYRAVEQSCISDNEQICLSL